MSLIDTLITDRTGGYYNERDLNRVGLVVAYMTDRLSDSGYLVDTAPKLDWTSADVPNTTQMAQYLGDVRRVRDCLGGAQQLPENMERLGWSDANDIEKALKETNTNLDRMIAATVAICGVVHCGGAL